MNTKNQENIDRQLEVYLTVLTNDKYIRGVKALKQSLKRVKSKHDLVILVPQTQEEYLRSVLEKNKILDQHCSISVKEDIIIEYPEGLEFKDHYWANTFFKLNVANCLEYKKIVLLDSDMIILRNIDHLFKKPNYSAAVAGQCEHPDWVKLNSGLMVIEPDKESFGKLLNSITPAMYRRYAEGYNIGDQDVFQEAYRDWEDHKELLLPEIYNCFFKTVRVLASKENISLHDIAVVHFIGKEKPWSYGCFTKQNIMQALSFLKHRKFYEFKVFVKYLLYAA